MKDNEKNTNSQSASFFKELGKFMKPYAGKFTLSVIISILAVMSNLACYGLAGKTAGILFSETVDFNQIIYLIAAMAVCKILCALFSGTSTWISHNAAYNTLKDIRNALADKMMRVPLGYFEANGSGRLKTMLVDRVEAIEKTLAHILPEMTANLLIPLAMVIWMFRVDWRLALCVLIWILIGFAASFGMMNGYEEKYAGQVAAAKGMNQAVTEYVDGIEVIKGFNRTDACYKKYEDAVVHNASYSVNWQKETQIFTSLGMAIAPFSVFSVLTAGLIFWNNGTLEPSTLFLFIILSLGFFAPLMKAVGYFDSMAQMGTIAKEIRDALDYPELKRGRIAASNAGYDIEISNLTFAYAESEDNAVDNISVNIPSGTMLALVGPSGGGKSTIAKLLAGYWDYTGGEIKIGGVKITDYSQDELNSLIAYVDQETFLFDMSIMDNIRIGDPSASDDAVIDAAVRAGCDEFIRTLPDGYHTRAGAAGGRLSGGERQRIAIARAMMKNAPIMILDEATASSDPENEAAIQQALSAAAADKTLIVVAHRLSSIISAEQIAFIKDGKINKIGTHGEMLKTCAEYTDLWKLSTDANGGTTNA